LNNVYGIFEKEGKSPAALAEIEDPAGTVFCGDGGSPSGIAFQVVGEGLTVNRGSRPPSISSVQGGFFGRHSDGCNVALLDGHVKSLRIPELARKTPMGRFAYFTPDLD